MRNIVREQGFEAELVALVGSIRDADEFVAAAELVLSMAPEMGLRAAADSAVWVLPMAPLDDGRQVSLFYAFDDLTVWFLFIEVYD